MLEHSSRNEAYKALHRWWEVLKPNGILRIAVPNLEVIFEYYLKTKDFSAIENILYGTQKHEFDFHHTGWTEATLTRDLRSVGFKSIRKYDWRETEHFYVDDYSQAYLPKISYFTRKLDGIIEGTLISLNMEATK
jgi:predicted SAM-dependent methyltransferase